ncbi:unnamed protein product [Acanthoscelides obtectus]|uniref:Uncharacterized protein n=1 Tax=Acanthoscelides obtectus TaxID=200917 RepID=A0A9P0KYL4_ACAOB|nr:unnamed protein product [Acanthoscelides obtectus]CAK1650470.1 hypothetical protein AOBTE_LOCUS16782 [Acanthoscelides obtectus]
MSSRCKRILAAALETDKNSQVLEEALSHSIIFTNEDVIIENVTNDGLSKWISEADPVLPLTLSYYDMNVDIIEALVHNADPVSPSKHAVGSTVLPTVASGENNVIQLRYADSDLNGTSENLQTSSELLEGEMKVPVYPKGC